jgi:hypothetical protein
VEEASGSGNPPPTPTLTPESLEIFIESDDSNPVHVNYDFTKSEPLSIINEDDDEIIEKVIRGKIKRHYKLKK